jgi:hypothetical protein
MASQPGQDWSVIESGSLYYRYLEYEEFSCDRYDCVGVAVYSYEGCPGGVYIEAAIESSGIVVGRTNEVIGALLPEQVGATILEDYQDMGDSFRISDVNCYQN